MELPGNYFKCYCKGQREVVDYCPAVHTPPSGMCFYHPNRAEYERIFGMKRMMKETMRGLGDKHEREI